MFGLGLMGARVPTPGEIVLQEGVAYRSEGRQLQEAGDLPRAAAAYRRAVMVYPKYAEAYNDLGVVLESMGDAKHAEEAYQIALRLKPELGPAHSNLALLHEERGKVKEAGEHWAARIRLGPPEDPWVTKAREKLAAHSLPVPVSALEPVKNKKDEIHRLLRTGQAHLEDKQWLKAAAEFERVLSLDPKNKQAQSLLRSARSAQEEEQRKMDRAVETSRRTVIKEAAAARQEEAKKEAVAGAPKDALALAQEYAREKAQVRKTATGELLDRATAAMREGSYREAADQYEQILLLEPDRREARQGLERANKALARQAEQ